MSGAQAEAEVWQADLSWQRIDLLSDVHLHADMPRTFEAWRDHLLSTPADAVLLLGDLFEVWVGDDASHQGFEAECVNVLRQASARKVLAFMPGNENRLSLLTKWLWQIGTRQYSSLLITGQPDQHMGVEVGLERAERSLVPSEGTVAATAGAASGPSGEAPETPGTSKPGQS